MNKYLAEVIGTFSLSLAVVIAVAITPPIPTPVIATLTLGLFVYTVGPICGAQLNPAITLGLFSLGKLNLIETAKYIFAQLIGAALAIFVAHYFTSPKLLPLTDTFPVFLAETIGTAFLAFGVASVVYGKVETVLSGVVIGVSLLIGICIAGSTSNGILNPAVALSLSSLSLAYLFGPLVGAVLGMHLFRILITKTHPEK
jgi:glycerol uptake facilitator-like aquaporin